MFFYFQPAINRSRKKKSLTLFRYAFPNIKQLGAFGDYRAKHGLEAAIPLFREITFTWEKARTPVGDIMGASVFSPRAAELIRSLRGEYELFEPIDIEGTPGFSVDTIHINDLSSDLDIFESKKYRRGTVVSQRFKNAWEAAGLLGAEFEALVGQPTP